MPLPLYCPGTTHGSLQHWQAHLKRAWSAWVTWGPGVPLALPWSLVRVTFNKSGRSRDSRGMCSREQLEPATAAVPFKPWTLHHGVPLQQAVAAWRAECRVVKGASCRTGQSTWSKHLDLVKAHSA